MISKIISFILIPFITLIFIWGLGWLWFATNIATTKAFEQDIKSHDVVVLTGGNGRINAALNLMVEAKANNLFISGVNKDVRKEDIFKSWKKLSSAPPCCITLGYQSTDTITNAIEVHDWANKKGISSFYLVTSSYHMPRAYMEVSQLLPAATIIKYPVFSNDFKAWQGRFWKLTFSEYNKSIIRWMQNVTTKEQTE